jgi:hypothetical protein
MIILLTVLFSMFSFAQADFGPLRVVPISQFSCAKIERPHGPERDTHFQLLAKYHFYFHPRLSPVAVTQDTYDLDFFCHDFIGYGPRDNELYPRLELLPGAFSAWDAFDPRFEDRDGNGILDVDDLIRRKSGGLKGPYFNLLSFLGFAYLNERAGNGESFTNSHSWILKPFIDKMTSKSYCPSSVHYNSMNRLFRALRDVVVVDTEGLYVGKDSLTSDHVMVTESDLKRVWFYVQNGVPTSPTEDNVSYQPVYFYYPLNFNTPYTRTSGQQLFRLQGSTSTHDRKIGCVPKF